MQEDAWHKVSEVIFHGVKGINLQDEESPSWYNDHEIARVLRYISSLYACGLKPEDIGIITPYQKQVSSTFSCFWLLLLVPIKHLPHVVDPV